MVRYIPAAEQELTRLWVEAPDRSEVTAAANAIDQVLGRNPLGVGESRAGESRILIVPPLAVNYYVVPDDVQVVVWQLWRWGLPEE
jgi:hypothetical protein